MQCSTIRGSVRTLTSPPRALCGRESVANKYLFRASRYSHYFFLVINYLSNHFNNIPKGVDAVHADQSVRLSTLTLWLASGLAVGYRYPDSRAGLWRFLMFTVDPLFTPSQHCLFSHMYFGWNQDGCAHGPKVLFQTAQHHSDYPRGY